MKLLILSSLLLGLISCSAKKQNNSELTEPAVELTDSSELSDELVESTSIADDQIVEDQANSEEMSTEQLSVDDYSNNAVEGEAVMIENAPQEIVIDQVSQTKEYKVKKGETLMMISFNIYGDYSKWRELASLNKEKVINGQIAPVGTVLKYNAPAEMFNWSPEGNPYLIKNGDSLGSISTDTYGTMKFWRNIWDNNKPLIKNPNKIFAGFTIYTPVAPGRDVATK